MIGIFLQRMVENLPEGSLPANWVDFDLASFSRGKRLYEYQQTALRNALLALWKYYAPQETAEVLKHEYTTWYQDFGLEANLDLPLDRSSARSGIQALKAARSYLERKCSVFFFPEGTRSEDRRVYDFNDGAFHLAIKAQVPVLPLAIEGASACLPKRSWIMGDPHDVHIQIMAPVETQGLTSRDVPLLRERVRAMIIGQIAQWQGVPAGQIDAAGVVRPHPNE